VCGSLAELKEAMGAYTAGFDAGLLASSELSVALCHAGAIEKMAASAACMLAARMATGAGASAGGPFAARQAAEALARSAGTSLAEARRAIGTGRAMAQEPELGAAARSGELSRQQAGLVAEALGAGPGAASELVGLARTASVPELALAAARARPAAEDQEAQRRRLYAARALRSWADGAGTWHLHAQGPVEQGAVVPSAAPAAGARTAGGPPARRDAPAGDTPGCAYMAAYSPLRPGRPIGGRARPQPWL
jgi:hypothetical protein